MSLSRSLCLFKNIKKSVINHKQIRHAGVAQATYRRSCAHFTPKSSFIIADVLMAYTVWWILWHFWHEPGHILGEYDYPDPSKWTDAELGIPPDDED